MELRQPGARDPELASRALAPCAIHTLSTAGLKGLDQYGQPFLDSPLDGIAGGGGAFTDRDGMDHAGPVCGVIVPITDIETSERKIPMLYLYRRELPQTGAHGQWRGGATIVAAWIGHKTKAAFASNGGLLQSVTQGLSLNGALPATGGRNWYAQGTAVQAWLRDGRLPRAQAERFYGVVLDDAGSVDAEATAARRQALRAERLAESRAPREPVAGRVEPDRAARGLLAGVVLADTAAGPAQACRHCGRLLATTAGCYRLGCRELEDDMTALSEFHLDPAEQAGQRLVLRRYLCPGCALALDAELCRPEDPPYVDLVLGKPAS